MPSNRRSLLAASNADSGGPFDVYYLVVGGGGGGASGNTADEAGGGGGGGGLLTNYPSSPYEIETGTAYTVTVGEGGAGGTSVAANGGNSVFDSFTAIGGGAGDDNGGANGGSGGGAGADDATDSSGGAGTVGQGNDGGDSRQSGEYGCGGGGGGGSGVGANAQLGDGSYLGMVQFTTTAASITSTVGGSVQNQPYTIPMPPSVGSSDYIVMSIFGDANGGGLTTPSGWTALANFTNLGTPDIYGGVFVRQGSPGSTISLTDAIDSRAVSYICARVDNAISFNQSRYQESEFGSIPGESTTTYINYLVRAVEENSTRSTPTGFTLLRSVTGGSFTYDTTQQAFWDVNSTTQPIFAGDSITPGDGGNGTSNSITGSSIIYAGGGGGGTAGASSGSSFGGSGVGGAGGGTSSAGGNGTNGRGGGGGGSATNTTAGAGDGGRGVVRLRFNSARSIASTTGTLSYSTATDGADTVATFTSGTGTVIFA